MGKKYFEKSSLFLLIPIFLSLLLIFNINKNLEQIDQVSKSLLKLDVSKFLAQTGGGGLELQTISRIKTALEEGLPLAGSWNSTTFDFRWQIGTLIPEGHIIMPWFGIPWQTFWGVDVKWDSVRGNYDGGIQFAALHKLPIAFKSPQWEAGLLNDFWCSKPPEENPCFQRLDGTFEYTLSPIGAIQPWYEIGYASANQDYLKKIQELYPDPPLVVFLENNEAPKNSDLLNNKQYIEKYGNDPNYRDPKFIAKIVEDGWRERYKALLKGFRDGLVSNGWKEKAIQIPYTGFYARGISEVIGEQAWDGAMARSYTARYDADRDYLTLSPQVEGGNQRFAFEEVRRKYNPNFFSDVITWYGDISAVQGLEYSGQTYTPERYRGTTQFVLWEIRPQSFREFRGSTEPRTGWYGILFRILLNSVDRVHYNPILRKFWKEGKLVANKTTPVWSRQSLPPEYADADVFFVLESDANAGVNWQSTGSTVNVFSLALVIGEKPNRQWLLYAHAPLGTLDNVGITIPDYKQVRVKVDIGGSFYLVDESKDTIEPIDELNFSHNHPPVAVDDTYTIGVNETLTVTNKWATIGAKPLWFNDIDEDGDPLTFELVDRPKHGTIIFNNDGTFSYTPNDSSVSKDTFTYKINDGQLDSNIATVTIEVATFSRVIDDGDPGYSEIDSWGTGEVRDTYVGYGPDYRYHVAGNDEGLEPISRATWTINNLAPDTYDIYTTWSPSWSRTTDAPYTIFDGENVLKTVHINQSQAPNDITAAGAPWEKLGSFNIQSGTLKVQVTDEAKWTTTGRTVVVADAIRVVRQSTGEEWYVDNRDSNYTETAYWASQKSDTSYNGDRRIQTLFPEGTSKAIWTFTDLSPGIYTVFVTWTASALNNAGTVNYDIFKDNQTFRKTISQTQAPASLFSNGIWWEDFGNFLVENGTLRIELNNIGKSGRIIADAIALRGPIFSGGMMIDDGDPGYTRIGWFHQKSWGFRGDGEYMYSEREGAWDAASWTFTQLNPGSYRVYVTWQDPGNWAPNADVYYTVYDNDQEKGSIFVSQHDSPSDKFLDNLGWKDLGVFNIESGTLKVKVSAAPTHSAGRVSADAVWIVPMEGTPPIPTYTISASASEGGRIIPSGNITVTRGANQNFNIVPNEGYHIANVIVDGINKGALTSYTFNNISEDHTIRVNFERNESSNLQEHCQDLDGDGINDYDPNNCPSGKDQCVQTKAQLTPQEKNQLKPVSSIFILNYPNNADITNLNDFTIKKERIAEIKFKTNLDLVRLNLNNGCFVRIVLDDGIEIGDRRVKIDTQKLPELNQPAQITFYNINFKNPIIKKDGQICSEPECRIIEYNKENGTLLIEVRGFSEYTVEEGFVFPSPTPSPSFLPSLPIPSSPPPPPPLPQKVITPSPTPIQKYKDIPKEFRFNRNLRYKQNLEDIRYLQIILNSDPDTKLKAKPNQYGSPGKETIHFGPLTRDAVIRFQEKYAQEILKPWGLKKGTGFVGPTTRAKLNELLTK